MLRKFATLPSIIFFILALPFSLAYALGGPNQLNTDLPLLVLQDGQEDYLIGRNISYLEDPSKELGILDVSSQPYFDQFQISNVDNLNFGLKDSAYWIRLTIKNESATERWYLELSRPSMNSVFFYAPSGSGFSEIKTGYVYPFSTRDVPHENFLFDLQLAPGDEQTYYLRAQDISLDLPLTVWSHDKFFQHDQLTRLILAMAFGALITIICYNVVLLLIMKELNYVFYALFQFFLLLFLSSLYGYAPRFLWPEFTLLNYFVIPLSNILLLIFLLLFSWDFLRFEERPKWVDFINSISISGLTISIFITFVVGARILLIITPLSILLILWIFLLSIWAFVRKFKPSRYFLFAWSVFFIIGVRMILNFMGLISISHILAETTLPLGAVYLVIFQSFALTDRINYFKQERLNAQNQLIQNQKENLTLKDQLNAALENTREELEQHVSLRTRELVDLNEKLSGEIQERVRAETELKHLASVDFLTGLFNRRYFFDIALTEFQRATRYNKPLSVIIFDIDHFKNVNDNHGHLAGDQALVQISKIIQEIIRKTDIAARYGGEEFVILLPENNQENALLFAKRLRGLVETSPIIYQSAEFQLTVSIGVAGVDDTSLVKDFDQLISFADKNLYKAKNSGRNQVIG